MHTEDSFVDLNMTFLMGNSLDIILGLLSYLHFVTEYVWRFLYLHRNIGACLFTSWILFTSLLFTVLYIYNYTTYMLYLLTSFLTSSLPSLLTYTTIIIFGPWPWLPCFGRSMADAGGFILYSSRGKVAKFVPIITWHFPSDHSVIPKDSLGSGKPPQIPSSFRFRNYRPRILDT